MIKVYTASKLKHAAMWQGAYSQFRYIHFVARWPFLTGMVEDSAENAAKFWEDDFRDVKESDIVLLYAQPEDKLRGALIEAGYGLARGKAVWCVGTSEDFGTWQWHTSVKRFTDLQVALNELNTEGKRRSG